VSVTVQNTAPPPGPGLVASYGFNENTGLLAGDSSGNGRIATITGPTWTAGKYGSALSFDGTNDLVDLPALGTFYRTAFTYEAWAKKSGTKIDVAVLGSWTSAGGGGPMIWIDHIAGRYNAALGSTLQNYLNSGRSPVVGQWQHLAVTFDGATLRFFIDGVEVASGLFSGDEGSSNTWRVGAYGATATGFFDGLIDEVRVYNRALSGSEIQSDMNTPIVPETIPPQVTGRSPAPNATLVNVGTRATASFSERMQSSSISASSFVLRDPGGAAVPANVSYDTATDTATLTPKAPLAFGTTYQATVKGGSTGVRDFAGNPLPSDVSWSFSTEGSPPPPVLVVSSAANPFGLYSAEVLRAEGLDDFTTIDIAFLTPAFASMFDVIVLGEMNLSAAQATLLSDYVTAGGNLIALRPDKKLAPLLGLTSASGTLANAYVKVATETEPGTGIVADTIQYHGTADRYTPSGATVVATLYSNATTATTNPAVTLRSVGTNGGQAAAFTYDLNRSIVYTRQGNPAWAGQERDGVAPIRPDDMFFGAKVGDVRTDWVNTNKISIPQADEQQRLLANLITMMERDRLPLPRFWYFPRGKQAVIVMSGDDHAFGGTASNFDRFKALSPPGCSVVDWECVRSTSYVYTNVPMTNAQAAAYTADGFEFALHPSTTCGDVSPSTLSSLFDSQFAEFAAKFSSVPAPTTSRTHCVVWPDWASEAKISLAHGIRMDANYYHYPGSWIGNKPGFMTGSGMPMRFADLDGTQIDVYQGHTHMTDESGQSYPATVDALLNKAVGPEGFYGAFGANVHTDSGAPNPTAEAIVASAQARGVPIISYRQLLEWTDARNASSFRSLAWSSGNLTFTINAAPSARGLQAMLPTRGPVGTLQSLTRSGSAVPFSVQTIKGVQYALFDAVDGAYAATYQTP
jgi:hypothetical protein